jgi:hypothetical protein
MSPFLTSKEDSSVEPKSKTITRARVMGYYSEPESLALRDRNCLPTPSLCFCYPGATGLCFGAR